MPANLWCIDASIGTDWPTTPRRRRHDLLPASSQETECFGRRRNVLSERMSTANTSHTSGAGRSIDSRVDAYNWASISEHLDAHGWAMFEELLTAGECAAIARLYADDRHFRSHVVMARHGFGRGEYKYFAYPLPDQVADLRTALYPRLAPIANRWSASMGIDVRYPNAHADFIARCHNAGPDAADAASAAVRRGRLQRAAPGPVRRTCLSAPGGDPALGAAEGLHRRRVRADRATAPDAVAG